MFVHLFGEVSARDTGELALDSALADFMAESPATPFGREWRGPGTAGIYCNSNSYN